MQWKVIGIRLLLAIALVFPTVGQETRGAKALFLDPSTGVAVIPRDPKPVAQSVGSIPSPKEPSSPVSSKIPSRPSTQKAELQENTGLMYWVELVKPNGELERVNTSRQFRSGERVRLHFESNFDGRLALFQKQDDKEVLELLFPDKRIAGGTDQIKANVDTVIPSERAWLKFDSNPGKVRLLVLLATEERYGEVIQSNIAGATLDRDKSLRIANRVERMRGSKGLVFEVEENSSQPATYVVNAGKRKSDPNAGFVGIEIVLEHRP